MQARGLVEESLARAQSLIEETGARAYAPFVAEESARLTALVGDARAAELALREAQRLFVDCGATGHAERLARELEEPS